MAEIINFEKILQEVSSDNKGAFALPTGNFYIFDVTNENQVLSYISLNVPTKWEDFKTSTKNIFDRAARSINDFFADVQKAFTTNISTLDFFKENENVSSIAEIPISNSTVLFVSLNFEAPVVLLETGLGKDYAWSKINIFDDQANPSAFKQAYCLTSNLKTTATATKRIIDYNFDIVTQIADIDIKKIKPKSLSVKNSISFDTRTNEVQFDENSACYYVSIETGLQDYSNLTEESVKAVVKKAYKDGIKKILNSNSRAQLDTNSNQDFDEIYYCLASAANYFLSPRRGEGLKIVIYFPYRNMILVSPVVDTPRSSASQNLKNVINNTSELIQQAGDAINGLTSDFNSTFNQQTIDALGLSGGGAGGTNSVANYLDPTSAASLQERSLILENNRVSFGQKFDKASEVLSVYAKTINEYLDSDEGQEARFFIDLNIYSSAFKKAKSLLETLLFVDNQEIANNPEYTKIELFFSQGLLKDVAFISKTFSDSPDVPLTSAAEIALTSPFNDVTFGVLLSNLNDIQSIDTKDPQLNAVLDFLSDYIYPEELAQADIPSTKNRSNKKCFKDQVTNLKDQFKQRTNESIRKTQLKESKDNLIKSASFVKGVFSSEATEEFNNLKNQLKERKTSDTARFTDPGLRTINWNQMIEVATNCIADKETRELARQILDVVRRSAITDTPILCNIPKVNLPQFPYIGLPRIPTIGSLVSSYYTQLSQAAYASRDDAIRSFIQGILDSLSACEVPGNIDQEGEEEAENLFGQLQQPISPTDERDARKIEFLNAGIFRNEQEAEQKIDQVRLFLTEISKVLTKNELVKVLSGVLDDPQYNIIKNTIDRLNSQNLISLIYDDVSTETKLLNFLAKFSELIRLDVYGAFFEINPFNTAQDINFICKDPSPFETAMANNYLERGLSPEQISDIINKRRNDIRNTISNLAKISEDLNKQKLEITGFNCKTNPDGSTTPGIAASLGVPEAFMELRKTFIRQLFWPFEKSFNEDLADWFNNNSEKSDGSNNVIFFKTLNSDFVYQIDGSGGSTFRAFIGAENKFLTTAAIRYFPLPIKIGSGNSDQSAVPEQIRQLLNYDLTSNDILLNSRVEYKVENLKVVSSKTRVTGSSKTGREEEQSKKIIVFGTEDKLYNSIFSVKADLEEFFAVYGSYKESLKDYIQKSWHLFSIDDNLAQTQRETNLFKNGPDLPLGLDKEYTIFANPYYDKSETDYSNAKFNNDLTFSFPNEYVEDLRGRVNVLGDKMRETSARLLQLRKTIDTKIYTEVNQALSEAKIKNALPVDDTTIIRDDFGTIKEDISNLFLSIVTINSSAKYDNIFDNFYKFRNTEASLERAQALSPVILSIGNKHLRNGGSPFWRDTQAFDIYSYDQDISFWQVDQRLNSFLFEDKAANQYSNFLDNINIIFNNFDKSALTKSEKVIDLSNFLAVSSFVLSSSVEQNLNVQLNIRTAQITEEDKSFVTKKIVNNFLEDFANNPFTKVTNVSNNILGIDFGLLTSTNLSIANQLNFVVSYSKEDEKCKRVDERLINVIPALKDQIISIASDPCYIPNVRKDGTVEDSPTFIATYTAAFQTLLRLYAIEYNLKLIAFNKYLSFLDTEVIYESFYHTFISDATVKFGKQVVDLMFEVLASAYIRERNLQTIVDNIKNDPVQRRLIFKHHFKVKHFKQTNLAIKELLKKDYNYKLIPDYFSEVRLLANYEKGFQQVKTSADYEFFRNVSSYLYGSKNNNFSSIKVLVEDSSIGAIYPLLAQGINIEATGLSSEALFLGYLFEFKNKVENYSAEYSTYFQFSEALANASQSLLDLKNGTSELTGDAYRSALEESIATAAAVREESMGKLKNYIEDMDKHFTEKLFPFLQSYSTRTFNDLNPANRNFLNLLDSYNFYIEREANRTYQSGRTRFSNDLVYQEKFEEYENYKFSIDMYLFDNNALSGAGKRYYLVGTFLRADNNEFEYFREQITEKAANDFVSRVSFPSKLRDANKVFNDIFTYCVSLDNIYSTIISSYFLVASSIKIFNTGFDTSKFKLKEVFEIIKSGNEYNYEPDINISLILQNFIKGSTKAVMNGVKNYAAATDLNIGISNTISKAYGSAIVALSNQGADVPIKHIPIWVPSAALAIAIPPSAAGVVADVFSALENPFKLYGNESLEWFLQESKKKC